MPSPPSPKGARVFLRSPAAADVEEFTRLNRASRAHYAGWVSPPTTAEAFAA